MGNVMDYFELNYKILLGFSSLFVKNYGGQAVAGTAV
jgi:hypothetical protein